MSSFSSTDQSTEHVPRDAVSGAEYCRADMRSQVRHGRATPRQAPNFHRNHATKEEGHPLFESMAAQTGGDIYYSKIERIGCLSFTSADHRRRDHVWRLEELSLKLGCLKAIVSLNVMMRATHVGFCRTINSIEGVTFEDSPGSLSWNRPENAVLSRGTSAQVLSLTLI